MGKQYDPPMHTAEHILNQTMVRLFQCGRCFSSHLNPGKAKCDYFFDRDLSEQEAEAISQQVNAVLAQNLEVTEEWLPRLLAGKLVSLDRLPADQSNAPDIRIVRIGGYDICPCIGAHVRYTGEAGLFRLVSHTFTPSGTPGQPGVLRLRFSLQRPAPDAPPA